MHLCLSITLVTLRHPQASSARLSGRNKRRGFRSCKCALCVLPQSAANIYRREVGVHAWTGFICNGPSHTYSQLGKLVEQGTNLATC